MGYQEPFEYYKERFKDAYSIRKIAYALVEVVFNDGRIFYVHHTTPTVMIDRGVATLQTGGWYTVTTRQKINQVLKLNNFDGQIYQRQYTWYLDRTGGEEPFFDGMKVYPRKEEKIA